MSTDDRQSAFSRLGSRGLIDQMHGQLDALLASRDQMESLLRVVVDIGSDLDLDITLHRIIRAAIDLTGARYGALGVRADDGGLATFLYDGIGPDLQTRIGHLPVGKGVLGVLLDRTEPLRVDDLTQHPAAVGFPEHHPPMRAFLGVPITIRGSVYGSLYVTDDRPGRMFSESDENAARALGAAAAVAIDNARMFARQRNSARWTGAGREITATLLSDAPVPGLPLQLIAERVGDLTGAEQVIVLVPADTDLPAEQVDVLTVATAAGCGPSEILIGQQIPVDGSTAGAVFRTAAAIITDRFRYPIPAFTDLGERPAIVVPLCGRERVIGVLAVARNIDQPAFTSDELESMVDFANHAAVALTLAQGRDQARELTILADRERIAHDLHDHVIQRLFAAGMDLQGTIARVHAPHVVERLTHTVDELQSTITEIRTTIFDLQSPMAAADGFRQRIQQVVADLTDDRDLRTTLRIIGPTVSVEPQLADHAVAVIIEAISNAVRHSGATNLTVEIAVADDLALTIFDNGHGIPGDNQRRSGLANMKHRAEQVVGTCEILTPAIGGTHIHWTAPLTNA